MNLKKLLPSIFFSLIIASACTNEDPIDPTPSEIAVNVKSANIIKADNQFGLELFQKINETDTENKNIMISPLSISLALGMAYNGAEGTTREQMEYMLHKINLSPDDINQSYKTLVEALRGHDVRVEMDIANAIFYNEDFSIKNDFLNTNKSFYDAEVKALDFGNSKNTLETINGWVKTNTKEKIKSIIDNISTQDAMVLANAIYFNGEWTYQFEKSNTDNRVFFFENGTNSQVPTMMIKEKFNYYKHDNFEMLELPYGGKKFSMIVMLPNDNTDVNQLVKMLNPQDMEEWVNKMEPWEKKVFLPKIEFAYDKGLNEELKALGMTDAFSDTKANFNGITEEPQIFISKIKHKSYIKVDEKGTEAAAVTAIVFRTTSVGTDEVFAADHPFVFVIKEKDTNAILFIGKVLNPEQN